MFRNALFFLLFALITATTYAGCPDPADIKIQEGTNHPRFITDSGWISDREAESLRNMSFKLVMVTIFNPNGADDIDIDTQTVKCLYNIVEGRGRSGSFNLYPPANKYDISGFQAVIAPTEIKSEWNTSNPSAYKRCRYSTSNEKKYACEFDLK